MEEITISKQDYEDFKEWQRLKNFIPPLDIHRKENWDTKYCQGYAKGEWDAKMWFAKELQKGNYPLRIKDVIDRAKRGWKPSNEQLQVIAEAVAYFGDSWASKNQEILQSLYDDLQKL